ncbi:class A beta-lactamase [Cellulomonas shaoxiangyii]|uniref:Beta-lactamase n=1 Tax=Cellulomonas shaoxiangyii TaxID=2566013 RepID=A0A4P7SM64_9CELL|nr:class A beta-lactamase [Cellulomonas shaoxiangyii]QCB94858.1 class A beta-lactamase [Cellulomonas shaoxiangyii]TGY82026.1 class A beta-lactamase [Cellulomonas shaoxiangyii]
MSHASGPSRRAVLQVGALALLVAACTAPRDATSSVATATSTPTPSATPTAPPALDLTAALADVEARHGVRLGVHAVDTAQGRTTGHRADERFAFCSTVKPLAAAAVLAARGVAGLDEAVPVTADDLVDFSPVTGERIGGTMTWRELGDAAVRYSDNTAGNLLLRDAGGPTGLTAYVRGIGDDVTRSDRWEPGLNATAPGDERDTSTPRALAATYGTLVVGDALGAREREVLADWLVRNTTGDALVRAAARPGWTVGDKTGAGAYATRNDVAVVWPGPLGTPEGAPVVLAILTDRPSPDAERTDAPLAEAAAVVLDALLAARTA